MKYHVNDGDKKPNTAGHRFLLYTEIMKNQRQFSMKLPTMNLHALHEIWLFYLN